MDLKERIDAVTQQARDNIVKYGLHLTGVFGGENGEPSFTYSAGFYKLGKPEIVMFGIPGRYAQVLINDVYDRVNGGWEIPIDRRIPGLIQGLDAVALHLKPEVYQRGGEFPISMANRLAEDDGFPVPEALGLFWPDKSNVFPWEPGFDEKFQGQQPEVWMRNQ